MLSESYIWLVILQVLTNNSICNSLLLEKGSWTNCNRNNIPKVLVFFLKSTVWKWQLSTQSEHTLICLVLTTTNWDIASFFREHFHGSQNVHSKFTPTVSDRTHLRAQIFWLSLLGPSSLTLPSSLEKNKSQFTSLVFNFSLLPLRINY